jgi:hypothetical protein
VNVSDSSGEAITLWSIQSRRNFARLQRTGWLRARRSMTCCEPVRPYQWLRDQLANRFGRRDFIAPIWAWYSYQGEQRQRPDLRCSGHMPKGTACVLLEIEMRASEVVLSRFDLWTLVLNNGYVYASEDEMSLIELPMQNIPLDQTFIERSWVRIFDLSFGDEELWGPRAKWPIQACIISVDWNSVKTVTEFVAR